MLSVPPERRYNLESGLEVVLGLLRLALGATYIAQEAVRLANIKFFAFAREKFKRSGQGPSFAASSRLSLCSNIARH